MNINDIDKILTAIAQKHCGIETLGLRNLDRLDFHDLSVITIRSALQAAFLAGVEAGARMSVEELKSYPNG